MTVAELIAQLQTLDPNRIVVMSSDGEGNSHSPLAGLYEGFYKKECTWGGQVYTQDDVDGATEEEIRDYDLKDGKPCLVLYPTN